MAAVIGRWIRRYAWVVFADLIGLATLVTLLSVAGSAAALKPALFILIMMVPVTGLLIMLLPAPQPAPRLAAQPVRRRTVYVSPRPCDQRR